MMKSMVQIVSFPSLCTLEATQMAGVAKLLHCDMNNFIFDANFLKKFQYTCMVLVITD